MPAPKLLDSWPPTMPAAPVLDPSRPRAGRALYLIAQPLTFPVASPAPSPAQIPSARESLGRHGLRVRAPPCRPFTEPARRMPAPPGLGETPTFSRNVCNRTGNSAPQRGWHRPSGWVHSPRQSHTPRSPRFAPEPASTGHLDLRGLAQPEFALRRWSSRTRDATGQPLHPTFSKISTRDLPRLAATGEGSS